VQGAASGIFPQALNVDGLEASCGNFPLFIRQIEAIFVR
jgi:hypothetical protein